MRVVKSYEPVEKHGPLVLGRKIVTFRVGIILRSFTVHEDLICATSDEFRRRLQPNRKAIEGNCSICYDELDPPQDEVTCCRAGCGQNFHEHCMEAWKSKQIGPAKCPICRQVWARKPDDIGRILDEATYIDQDAMQVYCNWLYTGLVRIRESASRDTEEFGVRTLQAWVVANWMEDMNFLKAVVANFIADNQFSGGFGLAGIKYAFDKDIDDSDSDPDDEDNFVDPMQQFVIDIYIAAADPESFRIGSKALPESFRTKLSYELLTRISSPPTLREILEEHTGGVYTIEDT